MTNLTINFILETIILCIAIEKALVYSKIVDISKEFGVSEAMMSYIVDKESSYKNCAVGDTKIVYPNGKQHASLGLVQINNYWNPHIPASLAYDVTWSLEFLASRLREGKGNMWTTYRAYMKLYPKASTMTPMASGES